MDMPAYLHHLRASTRRRSRYAHEDAVEVRCSFGDLRANGLDDSVNGQEMSIHGLNDSVDGQEMSIHGLDDSIDGQEMSIHRLDESVDGLNESIH